MTNKLNKKILYPVIFLILSAGSFLSWFSWTRFVEELSPINDLNWFMVQNFNWSFTTSDIFILAFNFGSNIIFSWYIFCDKKHRTNFWLQEK